LKGKLSFPFSADARLYGSGRFGNEPGHAVRPPSWAPSGQLQGPMIIAMITVRMVQPAVYEIVDMVTMRHLFMSAVWTVCV
jgi:hypothetical protein